MTREEERALELLAKGTIRRVGSCGSCAYYRYGTYGTCRVIRSWECGVPAEIVNDYEGDAELQVSPDFGCLLFLPEDGRTLLCTSCSKDQEVLLLGISGPRVCSSCGQLTATPATPAP